MIKVIIKLNMNHPCTKIIGTAYLSGAPEVIHHYLWGSCMLVNNEFSVECFVDHSLYCMFYFLSPLYCLTFKLQLLITPLVS